ncbi:MAG: hypothetical protein M1836_003927 [Candelina mexicana]|nr:MAG: hypothetical protein M1836_003927 [Candelina mexicana]
MAVHPERKINVMCQGKARARQVGCGRFDGTGRSMKRLQLDNTSKGTWNAKYGIANNSMGERYLSGYQVQRTILFRVESDEKSAGLIQQQKCTWEMYGKRNTTTETGEQEESDSSPNAHNWRWMDLCFEME